MLLTNKKEIIIKRNLSKFEALVKDVVQHNTVEGSFFQEEVHSNRSVLTDVELANFKKPTPVAETTYRSLDENEM